MLPSTDVNYNSLSPLYTPPHLLLSQFHGCTMKHSIKDPVTAPWGVRITKADFDKLKKGFRPQMMEDRWECRADDLPDQRGNTTVRFYRSWKRSEQVALQVKSYNDGAVVGEITWNQGYTEDPFTEEDAKELATNLCQNLLGCEWAITS